MNRVRIAVLDSGVHPTHPHVGGLAPGVWITAEGVSEDTLDRLGHGTAVASVIHHLAPEAEIVPVKIFDRQLATNLAIILRAIDWCLDHNIQIINLSLGTINENYRASFEKAILRTAQQNAVVVSAYAMKETRLLPGRLEGVIGVIADEHHEADTYSVHQLEGKVVFGTVPYPRDIPGVPRRVNLNGVSFSVARVAASLACLWRERPKEQTWEAFLASASLTTSLP